MVTDGKRIVPNQMCRLRQDDRAIPEQAGIGGEALRRQQSNKAKDSRALLLELL